MFSLYFDRRMLMISVQFFSLLLFPNVYFKKKELEFVKKT